jgi:hypothetical protein
MVRIHAFIQFSVHLLYSLCMSLSTVHRHTHSKVYYVSSYVHVIDGMVQSSTNVGAQVADGELIMGDGNILQNGSMVGSTENDTGKDSSYCFI